MKKVTKSELETEKFGEELAKKLSGREIIALYGGLGSGKTAFVRGLARGLGYEGEVTSPTFAIIHEYEGALYHFDMYRIHNFEDLCSTGFFDYLDSGVIVIEWSENIENFLPQNTINVGFEIGNSETERIIHLENISY